MNQEIKTIAALAAMINTHMASKEDIKEVKEDVTALRSEMKAGFERIENLLLAKQEQRLNELEARMKKLEDALAV
jgi:hypothetical protein